MNFESVIGLEIHAELETRSKMFCACPVVDLTEASPNTAVCPVCAGMPGVLPVANERAVEYALRVALALECEIANTSIFARKNYFYPDLPKGYQISQYEQPLAVNGRLAVRTTAGERIIRIRRVHLEEDTGKSAHIIGDGDSDLDEDHPNESQPGQSYSLVDLNRAGVPLLEIVTEPDMRSANEVRAFAKGLRSVLRYVGVNAGDMERGVLRIEPNVSVRPADSERLGTRTEVKNLNSLRALERAVDYEINHQIEIIRSGGRVVQQTVGWDEAQQKTVPQRVKEGEDDYRYFPEPDLPPLVVEDPWIEAIRVSLPELSLAKFNRFRQQYGLNAYDTDVLVAEKAVADFFERVVAAASTLEPKTIANWITGELFGLMNQTNIGIEEVRVTPQALSNLLQMAENGEINKNTAKKVLKEMFQTGDSPDYIVEARGLNQLSDAGQIATLVKDVLVEHTEQVETYLEGKDAISKWLFGQVMRKAKGKANPQLVEEELKSQLKALRVS